MPARDLFHDAVKIGLEKENWVITADPLFIKVDGKKAYVDLAAERMPIGADRCRSVPKRGQKRLRSRFKASSARRLFATCRKLSVSIRFIESC